MIQDEPVVIVDYDSEWPRLFEEERGRILGAVGPTVVALEHIGSTSVSGLAAKPIIDMLAAFRDLDDYRKCIEPLRSLGYTYVPEFETAVTGDPGARYFHKAPDGSPRGTAVYHLHTTALGSDFWERHLLFRDYLRSHPDTARDYAMLKRELATRHGRDWDGYVESKTAFIRTIDETARRERMAER